MSDDIGTLKDSTVDAAVAPGQTLLNLYGDGYSHDDPAKEGAELSQDREQWEAWWVCSRPHANTTFGETEYIVKRIGADDVVGTQSRCIAVAKAVRDDLARDLDEGEFIFFTGNGTRKFYIDFRPAGPLKLKSVNGASNATIDITQDGKVNVTTTSDITLDPGAGSVVKVGGDTYSIARYDELANWVNVGPGCLQMIYNFHTHAAFGAPPSNVCPPLPAAVGSTSGKCD